MKPKISVIIPFYNVEKYLEQCLLSVVEQTFSDIEILCVDDRGSDSSFEIANEYAKRDKRIRIIRHSENKGLGASRNTALAQAEAPVVTCLDSDDWLMPEALRISFAAMQNTEYDSVWFKFAHYLDDTDDYVISEGYLDFCESPGGPVELTADNFFLYPHISCGRLFRRDFLLRHGISWPEKIINEDLPFYIKFHSLSRMTYLIDEFFYVYRQRSGSIMNQAVFDKSRLKDIFLGIDDAVSFLQQHELLDELRPAIAVVLDQVATSRLRYHDGNQGLHRIITDLLEKIDFPEKCENAHNFPLLRRMQRFSPSSPWRLYQMLCPLLLIVNRVNPFAGNRRKMRTLLRDLLYISGSNKKKDAPLKYVRYPAIERAFNS